MKKNLNEKRFFLVFGVTLCLLLLANSVYGQAGKTEWRQLFNGKDLTGWKQAGPGSHYVEDGFIKSKGGMGLLYWEGEKFGNCVIRVVFRMRDENSNSGVFIRIPSVPTEDNMMPVNTGYEVQIDNKPELSGTLNLPIFCKFSEHAFF